MPTRLGNRPGSGCRADCLHRAMVLDYRATKSAADEHRKIERELATNGYEVEGKAWDQDHPPLTFKSYLQANVKRSRVVDMRTATTDRYTASGALSDAYLATLSIEDRNRYLDDCQAARDLDTIERGYAVDGEAEHERRIEAEIARREEAVDSIPEWF